MSFVLNRNVSFSIVEKNVAMIKKSWNRKANVLSKQNPLIFFYFIKLNTLLSYCKTKKMKNGNDNKVIHKQIKNGNSTH